MSKSYVYFNLHKSCWSRMVRGLVVEHSASVVIANAEFVVRPAGHRKVIAERRKNVHAFVRGPCVKTEIPLDVELTQVSYNPFRGAGFYRKDSGEPVTRASLVELRADRTVWAADVQ